MKWPGGPTFWTVGRTLYASIPFTWNLPEVERQLGWYKRVIVGGPGIYLMPDYFNKHKQVRVRKRCGMIVLQRVNEYATKTSEGCVRDCEFCAVPQLEGKLHHFKDWPDLPIIIDNNLLATRTSHFNRVIDRLIDWGWADFNQGLDARLLTEHHAKRIAEIKKPMVRLALDSMDEQEQWAVAYDRLRSAGIAKSRIRSYALIGFDSDPGEAWDRCLWIEEQGPIVLPMWFHELDALQHNIVTEKQKALGWTDYERRRIMQWYYQHKKAAGGDK